MILANQFSALDAAVYTGQSRLTTDGSCWEVFGHPNDR
jgi:hypothetical protein